MFSDTVGSLKRSVNKMSLFLPVVYQLYNVIDQHKITSWIKNMHLFLNVWAQPKLKIKSAETGARVVLRFFVILMNETFLLNSSPIKCEKFTFLCLIRCTETLSVLPFLNKSCVKRYCMQNIHFGVIEYVEGRVQVICFSDVTHFMPRQILQVKRSTVHVVI